MDYLGFCALQKQFAVEYEFCNYKLKNYICAAASKACDLTSKSDRSEFLNTLARFSAALCGASSEFNKLPEESRFRINRLHVGVPARKILDLLWDVSRAADAIKFDELRFESWQAVMIENGLPCRYGDWVSILDQVEEIDFASIKNSPAASAPGETIQQAALRAVVDGGLSGVLNQADSCSAVDKASATMSDMLKKDSGYYDWTVDQWVRHLSRSRKTIIKTPAWDHIRSWRNDNKKSVKVSEPSFEEN